MNTMNSDTEALHVVLGAGQIGQLLRDHLLVKGHRVRMVQRGEMSSPGQTNLEHVRGDMSSLAFAEDATRGAAVVYDCMNPAYHKWSKLLLPLGRGSLHGAQAAGAKLVALDCLYMYGRPNGPMREDAARTPCSKKGQLRLELEQMRMNAHRAGNVAVSIGRASDFIGPSLVSSFWSARFFDRIFAGSTGECLGDPTLLHSYSDVSDVARGLATLGAHDHAMGRVWHLPAAPAQSTQAIADMFGEALGTQVTMRPFAHWQLRALGMFIPALGEMVEMSYQFQSPFELDSSAFTLTFGLSATPLSETVSRTAAWASAQRTRA